MARKNAPLPTVNWLIGGNINGAHTYVSVTTEMNGYGFAFLAAERAYPGIEITSYRTVK